MKVLNLCCGAGHTFEGWFGGEDEYQDQQSRGLLVCPLCGDATVSKRPTAPRLNLQAQQAPAGAGGEPLAPELQARWLRAVRTVLARTEDVGTEFPDKALRMHNGEEVARPIRGQATPEQVQTLLDEGVDLLPLPALPAVKDTLQ